MKKHKEDETKKRDELKTVGFQISKKTHGLLKMHALKNGQTIRGLLTGMVEVMVVKEK